MADLASVDSQSRVGEKKIEQQALSFDIEDLREQATSLARTIINPVDRVHTSLLLLYVKTGKFYHVWRVLLNVRNGKHGHSEILQHFALRISREDAPLKPYMIRNEVGCLRYIASKLPHVPAPKVLTWNDGSLGSRPFIAESFIEGQLLSTAWPSLSIQQKYDITKEIINVIVNLGETRFHFIGGLTPDGNQGPLVEKGEVIKEIEIFQTPENIHIGPYTFVKEYLISRLHREILYWSQVNQNPDSRSFDPDAVTEIVKRLKDSLSSLVTGANDDFIQSLEAKPRVLHNEELNSRNMIVHNGHLVGIIDWKFSGVYPLTGRNNDSVIFLDSESSRFTSTGDHLLGSMSLSEQLLSTLKDSVKQRGQGNQDIVALYSQDEELKAV